MSVASFSLRRPVTSIVLSIIIVLFGGIGFSFLGVREYPAIDPPTITVRTAYTGANADIIESQITEPLERAINGVQGIRAISSSSNLGTSVITVEFELGADLEQAANDVRDKVSQSVRNLPQDIDAPPVVSKADANGDPIIFMPVQSATMNVTELSDYAENVLVEKLQTIPGVSQVSMFGQRKPSMRLWMKPEKLAAYSLTVNDVLSALSRENIELPSGKVRGNATELTVKTFGRLVTEADFNEMIIREKGSQIIRFKDIGEAMIGPENEETSARRNNIYGVNLAIIPQPGANYITIANEFYKRFQEIKSTLPQGMIIDVGIDKSKFVRKAITEVAETLLIAIVLVVLIVYVFFRSWSIAFRPLIDIPVSLIGAFFIMYIFGFSINILTLLAIVLATGLVVDDGIVVTENIFKKIEQGMSVREAALSGTEEIFFAVVSTSLTLAAVFIPVIFLQGFTGRLFREFGIVVAGAVLISAVVSLTLTPVLTVKLTRSSGSSHEDSWFYRVTEPFYRWMENTYRRSLERVIRRAWFSLGILVVCMSAIYTVNSLLKTELAPLEDRSLVRTSVTAPEGTDFDATENIIYRLSQAVIDSVPEARMVFGITAGGLGSIGSSNTGFISVLLTDPDARKTSQQQVYERLLRLYRRFPEARAFPNQEQTISTSLAGGSALPVQFVMQNLNFEKIREALPKFMDLARKSPVFANVDANLKFNKPELNVSIDRLRAAELGVSVSDIAQTLQLALSGRRFGYFLMNGKQYQVIGQVDRSNRDKPSELEGLYVRNNRGEMIQLANLVRYEESSNPPTLFHYNRYKSATISAALAPGKTLGEGIAAMQEIGKQVLDDSFRTDLSGASRDFAESSSNTSFAFIIALVIVYLILAAQFESFRDPFIIMLTVPLALAGAFVSLWATGQTMNIFSQIGMIMLIGLVTKNGIMLVEFAVHKRNQGMNILEATTEAAVARLRPILMTSLATVLGALPIALGLGAASRSRMPLGIVVVGGMMFALILTLYVIPAMYVLLGKKELASSATQEPLSETVQVLQESAHA